jgi:hypothetical protein
LLEPHAAGQQQAVDRSAEEGQWSNLEELHLPAACGPQAAAAQPSAEVLQSALYKRFHYRLTAPLARESLIAEALAASSTDHPQASLAVSLHLVVLLAQLPAVDLRHCMAASRALAVSSCTRQ